MKPFIPVFLTLIFALSVLPLTAQDTTPEATDEVLLARPPVQAVATNGGVTLERLFPSLLQGQVGLLYLRGTNVEEARILFRNREYPFFNATGDEWYGFVVADMDAQPRSYPLSVIIRLTDGATVNFADTINIESGGFIRQIFEVPPSLGYLIDPVVERNEFARLDALIHDYSDVRYWDNIAWSLPIDTEFSARFGQYRILNEAVQTRHTGWDQSAVPGTSVAAMADGVIAFADRLAIRGNYILIDHGWGVYTGYAHLSQINVQAGETVSRGQIIGASGNTGRSNGPHLHWEISVNGEWIDGVLFLETWLP